MTEHEAYEAFLHAVAPLDSDDERLARVSFHNGWQARGDGFPPVLGALLAVGVVLAFVAYIAYLGFS